VTIVPVTALLKVCCQLLTAALVSGIGSSAWIFRATGSRRLAGMMLPGNKVRTPLLPVLAGS
jgi:hypothetical protein